MALVVKDRVKQFSTTTGTGTITLGSTPTGFQPFSSIGDGSTTYYAIVDNNNGDWEVGLGIYTASGTTLSRDTVLESSNAGSLVNFSSDTKEVFVTYPAEKAVYGQANDTIQASTLGTDADPAYSFAADPNTGVYSPGADQLALTTGGVERLTVSTTQVTATLPLRGQDGTAAAPALSASADTNTGVYFPAADTVGIATGGTERFRIDANGDIINNGVFYYNSRTITASITLSATSNAMSVGPVIVVDPAIVTVPDGGSWLIS